MSASNPQLDPTNFSGSQPKKPTSQRKIDANRRNARHSTGPTTTRGKRIVSQNALKHGLLAREVVIRRGDGQEDVKEFQELLERLWGHYRPAGIMEEMLVEKIATSWWRLARVQRAEVGEIRKKVDSAVLEHCVAKSSEYSLRLFDLDSASAGRLYCETNEADKKISSEERSLAIQRIVTNFRKNTTGVMYLCKVLIEMKCELTETGQISSPLRDRFQCTFGVCDYAFVVAVLSLLKDESQGGQTGCDEARNQSGQVNCALGLIDYQLKDLQHVMALAYEKEKLEEEAERLSLSLPPLEATDKLLRYETHLERQLYRAVDQLERIQRRRNGDSVPPPLSVNFARRA